MATHPVQRQVPEPTNPIIRWLLDSDPSIRWQVMRDLTDCGATGRDPPRRCFSQQQKRGISAKGSLALDVRVAEAITLVASKRDNYGRWPLEVQYSGKMPVEMNEGEG